MIKFSLRYKVIITLADWLLVATDKLEDWLSSAQEWLDEHSLRQYHADIQANIKVATRQLEDAHTDYLVARTYFNAAYDRLNAAERKVCALNRCAKED